MSSCHADAIFQHPDQSRSSLVASEPGIGTEALQISRGPKL
jgi:hypothetical protein